MDAFEICNADGGSDIVLLCEHASNHVPREYRALGLTAKQLRRHIAWDIGAAAVTRRLAALLDAPAVLGTCSRLVIDLNRPPHVAQSIAETSDDTPVPGNQSITDVDRRRRIARFFEPFHCHVSAILDARRHADRPVRLVSIHSFTPVYQGAPRPWHAGVLFGNASRFGRKVVECLRMDSPLHVGENVPYGVGPEEDYALIVHGDQRGIPAILVEIRQDQLMRSAGIEEWAQRLRRALET